MRRLQLKPILFDLPSEQRESLVMWMLDEGLSYRDAAVRMKEQFGVEVSFQKFARFWHEVCVPRKLQRSSAAATCVRTLADSLDVDWQGANAQLIGQKIFEMLASPETDVKTVCALGGVLEKVKTRALHEKSLKARLAAEKRRFKQRESQLALAREKFEFDAVDAALAHAPAIRTITADGKLSTDEKRERLRRLLFPQAFEMEEVAPAA